MKKILFLGGAHSQVPAIKYAVERGLYVITADYLPGNPGHQFSHEYHNISTVDRDEILKLSHKLKIDAISPYASDPAAPTAAWVAEKMGLVGGSFNAVETLSDKRLFRNFLQKNGFNTPWFIAGDNLTLVLKEYDGCPAVLKPVDSSGSKGLYRLSGRDDLIKYFDGSRGWSRSGQVIIEEFIEGKGPHIHGEGFVINGKIVFLELGDQIFSRINPLAPFSTMYPSVEHQDIMQEVKSLVEDAVVKTGYVTGGLNIEVIRDNNDNLYILEIGARSGGNYMTHLMSLATGCSLVRANIDALTGDEVDFNSVRKAKDHYFAQIILHAQHNGFLKGIDIPEIVNNSIIEDYYYYKKGDKVREYSNSGDVIGVVLLKLDGKSDITGYSEIIKESDWVSVKKHDVSDYSTKAVPA